MVKLVLVEKWSKKYKRSINCKNPKGFSQRAHCQGRKKNENMKLVLKEKQISEQTNQVSQVYSNYGEFKKALKMILTAATTGKKAGEVIKTGIGMIPVVGNVTSGLDLLKKLYFDSDNKKTDTYLDNFAVDKEFSRIVDDKVEVAFLEDLIKQIEQTPDQTPLPQTFDINKKLQDFLRRNFNKRTLTK